MTYFYIAAMLVLLVLPPLMFRANSKNLTEKSASKNKIDEVADALAILNLQVGATIDEIKEAHRKMIQQNHPDKGGNMIIASSINRARDVLIKGGRQNHKHAA